MLLLAISAVLSGAEGWEDIEKFGHLKLNWLKKHRSFKYGIPKYGNIVRVICRLRADEIEHAFQSWISSLIEVTGCDVIAIDGKTASRSFTTKYRKNALHTVNAWSCQHQLVLGQTAVSEKSNEITAINELLAMLDIETRTCHQLLIDRNWLAKTYRWSGLKSVIKVHAQIHDKSTGKDMTEIRRYIRPLGLNTEQASHAVHSH